MILSIPFTTQATVSSETTRVKYTCNGTTTVYAYPFKIYEDDDLLATKAMTSTGAETALVLNTDYTVSGAGVAGGGNLTLTAGSVCASGSTLTILRNIELTQETDYVDGQAFSAESLESAIDKVTLIQQQQNEAIGRAPKLPKTSSITDIALPNPAASHYIGWNAGATQLENKTSPVALTTATQYEIDALVTYGGGSSFTQATIQSALTAIGTSNKVTLLIRPGTWPIISNADWSAYTNVTFKIVPGAVISRGAFTIAFANAPDAGIYQIFSGTGVVTFVYSNEVYPEWFGDGTDYGVMITLSYKSIQAVGGKIVLSRAMTATTAVNTSSNDAATSGKGVVIEGRSAAQGSGGTGFPILTFNMSGGNAWDATGSSYLTFRNFVIGTDTTNYPAVGILLARDANGFGAAGHRFDNFRIDYNAKFSNTALYNYGVEVIDFIGSQFTNRIAGTRAVALTATNVDSVASAFATIATGTKSMTMINFYGGSYIQRGAAGTSDVFYLNGASDIHWYGSFWQNGTGRAFVTLDAVGGGCAMISFDGIRGEVGLKPTTGFRFISVAGAQTFVNIGIRNSRIDVSTDMINADANSTLKQLAYENVHAQTAAGITATNIQYSSLDLMGNALAISGTSTKNFIKNDMSATTIGTRLNDIIYDTETGEWNTFQPFGALANSATPSVANRGWWATGGTTTITNLTGGREGQIIHIYADHTITITDGTNIFLNGSANWIMTSTDTLTLIYRQTKWYELSRGDNGA